MSEPFQPQPIERVDPSRQIFDETIGRAPGRGRLAGRRVLVVGGGQRPLQAGDPPVIGNGRAISLLCAREGAGVAVADLDGASAADTVKAIVRDGGQGVAITADVARPEQIELMVGEAMERLGGLDGLVLNVGIAGPPGGLAAMTPEVWDRVSAVNLRSHMLTCRAAMPRMEPGSAIVFIASVSGLRPNTFNPVYDTTKGALAPLCRHVAREGQERSIRANLVSPGLMDTPLGRDANRRRPDRSKGLQPFNRQGTGWDTAYATLFLLSHDSAYVNAQNLVVDGGLIDLWWMPG